MFYENGNNIVKMLILPKMIRIRVRIVRIWSNQNSQILMVGMYNNFGKLVVSEHKHSIELNRNIPHSSAIPLPGIYPTEMGI